MAITEEELIERLGEVQDPLIEDDVVTLDLVNDVSIEDGTATVSLAFNAPYAPTEIDIGNRIRETIEDAGLEADLRAHVGEEHGFDEEVLPQVRNVIAVASGKGGVGKTTVAANIAAGLDKLGAVVGILDADIHGPNVPRILPVEGEPGVTEDESLAPPVSDGVKVMSMGFLTEGQDDPAIMRGPMVNNVMTHLFENVEWGYLDYLVVDLPPGTGDASLDLLQQLPVTGAVIVTTPQQMAVDDARKGLRLFEKHNTPILGVVENMSTFRCPSCEDEHDPFGQVGAKAISEEYGVPILENLPIHPDYGADGTEDPVVKDDDSPVRDVTGDLVEAVADRIGEVNRRRVARREESIMDEPDVDPAGRANESAD